MQRSKTRAETRESRTQISLWEIGLFWVDQQIADHEFLALFGRNAVSSRNKVLPSRRCTKRDTLAEISIDTLIPFVLLDGRERTSRSLFPVKDERFRLWLGALWRRHVRSHLTLLWSWTWLLLESSLSTFLDKYKKWRLWKKCINHYRDWKHCY